MKLREDLNALTPRLRRYARALSTGDPGGSERADDLVHATLMRALGSRNLGSHADLVVRLYATLTQLHREVSGASEPPGSSSDAGKPPMIAKQSSARPMIFAVRQSKLTTGLMALPLEDREALLLVALEKFDHGEAARILRISRTGLFARLTRARLAMEGVLQTAYGASTAPQPPQERDRQGPYLRLVK